MISVKYFIFIYFIPFHIVRENILKRVNIKIKKCAFYVTSNGATANNYFHKVLLYVGNFIVQMKLYYSNLFV